MAHDHTLGQFEDAVDAVGFGVTFVTLAVARVFVDEKVADVEQAAGAQYAPDLRDEGALRLVLRDAGKRGEEQHGVERTALEGQRASVVADEAHARKLSAAAREHGLREVHADGVLITGPR